jgi:pimeloyl-ACP methyl ester carboxylesterase
MRFHATAVLAVVLALTGCTMPMTRGGEAQLVSSDHFVRVRSTAPAMAGEEASLYVREVVRAGGADAAAARGVVLFVHGAGTPAEVSFDAGYRDHSWMAYLARAGYDVFSMDMTGYGRSTRPRAMADACNFSSAQQPQFVPGQIAAPCAGSHPGPMTTMSSDWNDLDAVVNHLLALRRVDQVFLVAWSQGGPRAGGYAALHPAKVKRLVVLAPAYNRESALEAPVPLPAGNGSMSSQSQADFVANWDRQVGCPSQYDPAAGAAIWADMIASDPVGATWGKGVRRAPIVPTWGFNRAAVARIQTPFLMVAGAHDKQVVPQRVHELYDDVGSSQKVLVDLACSSHNAMWEKNRHLLYQASLEWIRDGRVNGTSQGVLKLGD